MAVEDWLRELAGLGEEVWAEYARRQDPLKGLVSPERYLGMYRTASACGREEAARLAGELPGFGPERAAAELGVTVRDVPMPAGAGRVTFACFYEPDEIEVYADNVEASQALLDDGGLSAVLGEMRVRDVLLSHELFHVVCDRARREGRTLYPEERLVDLPGPRFLHRTSTLPSLEEVAAMAFARAFAPCPCEPYALNVLMLLAAAPEDAREQYVAITDIARELEGDRA